MEENNVVQTQEAATTTEPAKKNNTGLIVALGCVGAVLLVGIIIVIIVIIVLVINSSKKLTCTNTQTSYGCTLTSTLDVKFNASGRAQKAFMKGKLDCSNSSIMTDTYLDTVAKTYESKGDYTNVKKEGKVITFDYAKDNINELDVKDLSNSKIGATYDEAKKNLEKAGFNCSK